MLHPFRREQMRENSRTFARRIKCPPPRGRAADGNATIISSMMPNTVRRYVIADEERTAPLNGSRVINAFTPVAL